MAPLCNYSDARDLFNLIIARGSEKSSCQVALQPTAQQYRTMPFNNDLELQLILDTALDGVIVMRSDGTVADWNAQAERIFGWSRSEVVGQQMSAFIVPDRYRAGHHKGLDHYLATGEGPLLRKHVEISALRKGGEEFPVELSINPLRRNNEVLFLGFARDISVRVKTEADRTRRLREAELMHRVTTLAADTSTLDEMLRLCLSSVCELIQWPFGHAFLPSTSGERHLVSSVWEGDTTRISRFKELSETTKFTMNLGFPGRIWLTQEPIILRDIREVDWFARRDVSDSGIGSAFGFPIITAGEVVAVLEFFNTVPTDIHPELLLTARSMGDQIGRVLERQRVHERQNLLLHELDHRAKNMLAVVMAMATQTARDAPSINEFIQGYLGRLGALSRSHSLLTAGRWQPTTLKALADEVVGPHLSTDQGTLNVAGGELVLPSKAALAVGMILHELTNNAVKYGALSVGGRISITCDQDNSAEIPMILLRWKENGLRNIQAPSHRGFGSKLIEATIRFELHGRGDVAYEPDGIRYDISFPKARTNETESNDSPPF
jgi:PAS domain S-box-containing protein